ncbi:MAG: PEP-CTERM sorting domain-containing protein [Steroidobacteraceae bacterium]
MRKSIAIFLAAALLVASAPFSHADTITTFNVLGTAGNASSHTLGTCSAGSQCSFSGTLSVDVTAGTVTGIDITFPGLSPFNALSCCSSPGFVPAYNGEQSLALIFTTAPSPGSLVGFDGGSILDEGFVTTGPDFYNYVVEGGSITAPTPTVPEPGSLVLMLAGLCASSLFSRRAAATARPQAAG